MATRSTEGREMKTQAIYLATGPSYLHYLTTSVWTLRRHWDGEIVVHAWADRGKHKGSFEVVEEIARDKRLGLEVRRYDPEYRGRNATFECKPTMMQGLDCDVGLFIDADTIVCGDVRSVVDAAAKYGFAATQFCDWTTETKTINKRMQNLRGVPEIPQDMVTTVMSYIFPSINTGIFACSPMSRVLPVWYRWTVAARRTFIPDETTIHVAMPVFMPTRELTVVQGGEYNCSPKFQPKGLADENVVVWHFHRHGNVRPKYIDGVEMDGAKSQKGFDLWWPEYAECLRENVGNIRDWRGRVRNKWLDAIEKKFPEMFK